MPKDPSASSSKKVTRSRAACLNCKSVKQRCDGTSDEFLRCRRCELYQLECRFPVSCGAEYTVPQKPRPPPIVPPVAGPSSERTAQQVVIPDSLTDKLFDIAARLATIESNLQINRATSYTPDSPQLDSPHSMEHDSSEPGFLQPAGIFSQVSSVAVAVERVVGATARFNEGHSDYGAPDAIKRGIVTVEQSQELFDFFFTELHPWIMMLSLEDDRDAMVVSFDCPFPSKLHSTLSIFTNNIIAPILLSPQPKEINTDFLRAIDLFNVHKTVQFAARRSEGMDDAEGMMKTKLNGLASFMLQGILARTSDRLSLPSVTTSFLRAHASGSNIPTEIISDLRLYYWLLINDIHGAIQSGSSPGMPISSDLLKTTRIFASMRHQPYDARLAATTELFELARPLLRSAEYEKSKRLNRVELEQYIAGVGFWEGYWSPILIAAVAVDPMAVSFTSCFKSLATLTFNACAFNSWKRALRTGTSLSPPNVRNADVKPSISPRALTEWEFQCLTVGVKESEYLIFCLSEESRMHGGFRSVQWDARGNEGYRKLVCDEFVIASQLHSMDAITCAAYIFPLIFLVKLFNEGLLTASLVLLAYPVPQPPFLIYEKLPRLLEIGAEHLSRISTNLQHPSKHHAIVLRALLDAGLRGEKLEKGPFPQLPRHASVVLSPAPLNDYPSAPDPLLDLWTPPSAISTPYAIPATLSSLQQQRYQLQMHQMAEHQHHHENGRAASTLHGTGLEAVLDNELSLFGDNAALWNWGNGHDAGRLY